MYFPSIFNPVIRTRSSFMVIFIANVARFFATLVTIIRIFNKTIRIFRDSFSFSRGSRGSWKSRGSRESRGSKGSKGTYFI